MRANRLLYVVMAAAMVACALVLANSRGLAQPQAGKPAVAWEYKSLAWSGGDPISAMNKLGQEGWELATARPYGNYETGAFYIFNRPKP